jgi:hypothetical protein
VLACLVVAVACGDDPLRVEDYDARYFEAWCRYQVRCGVYPDLASCEALDRFPSDPDLVAAVRAGTVEWHAEEAEACIAQLTDLSCDQSSQDYRFSGLPCHGAFTGTLHEGDACAFGLECISLECWTESLQCNEACCHGTCEGDVRPPVARLGDRCRYAPCVEGFCEASICVPLKSEGTECDTDRQCDIGLGCDSDVRAGGFGTCQRLPATGESCTGPAGPVRCAQIGERCRASTGRCERGRILGEACEDNTDCLSNRCDETSHCVALFTPEGPGASCAYHENCAAPLVCEIASGAVSGTCIMPKVDGETCRYDAECASYRCDGLGRCSSEACI